MKPENFPERVVWYSIIGTYVIYFCGLQYTFVPFIPWILTLYLVKKLWFQTKETPQEDKIVIPPAVWIWIIAVLVVEFTLIVNHQDWNLGLQQTIFTSINWARGWGLVALFPLIGCLKIRPQLIYRAICIVCLQSLVLIPICYAASIINLPSPLYTSPLKSISGGGKLYYDVYLHIVDPENGGQIRLSLFTPWAPALGLVGNVYLVLASRESNKLWRYIGMIGAIAMIFVSVSRLAIISLPTIPVLTWYAINFTRPYIQIITGLASLFSTIFSQYLIELFQDLKDAFTSARAQSSRVREVLGRLALQQWWNDAPVWGHGITPAKGPKLTAEMPIGSHHTWFGLLYINGLIGTVAISIAFAISLITLLVKAQDERIAKVGLSIFLVLLFFTFGENVDALAYVYWPGLVMLGIAFKQGTKIPESKDRFLHGSDRAPIEAIPNSSPNYVIEYSQKIFNQLKQKLSNKFVRNMGWLGGAELINRVFRLGSTVVLARVLTAYDYGLLAVVMTTYDFASVFVQKSGIGAKLIQAEEEDLQALCNTGYWLSWILCSILFVIQCVVAIILSLVYHDKNLILPISVIGLSYLLIPLFEVQSALVQRENRLDVIATCNALQGMIGNVMTVVLALLGMGIWAVMIPFVLSTFVWVFINRKNNSWRPKKSFTLDRWQEIALFGKNILIIELLNKLRANLDYLLVGAFLGIKELGIYYFAFNAGIGISLNVINAFVASLYPYLCTARENIQEMQKKYFQSLKTIASIVIPLVLLQSALSNFYVPIIFGQKWVEAVPILILVCLSAIPRPFAEAASILLIAVDKGQTTVYWNIIFTVLFGLSLLLTVQWGVLWVASTVLIIHLLAIPVFTLWATRRVFTKS
ncbi:hypothetical protein NUACC21_57100 [Scytonema sp. NUACC21]